MVRGIGFYKHIFCFFFVFFWGFFFCFFLLLLFFENSERTESKIQQNMYTLLGGKDRCIVICHVPMTVQSCDIN